MSPTPSTPPTAPGSTTAHRTTSPAPAPVGDTEQPLTPAEVAAQVAEAARLREDLSRIDTRMGALSQKLATAAARESAALQLVRATTEQADAAQAALDQARLQLSSLAATRARTRRELGQWARDTYMAGGLISTYDELLTVLSSRSTGDVGHDLALLSQIGVADSATLTRLDAATTGQESVVAMAAQAAAASIAARDAAAAAKRQADRLLAALHVVLAELQAEQQRTIDAAFQAQGNLAGSTDLTAIAAAARLAQALATPSPRSRSGIPPGDCRGLNTAGYANGEIPTAALCPIWGAPGQLLRADAAAAFDAMSRAYAAAFGRPICVTDSYRSRTAQVALYAEKPTLAAIPGHSNHGWGTAVDLCGGIESFGTVQHAWLLSRAPAYGWFHPAWAEPDGSRPEPWHWEFAG